MSLSLARTLKSVSGQTLGCLANVLRKGADHAAMLKVDEAVMLGLRLYPDMFPLSRQVQIACDQAARGAARLAGTPLPSFPDVETSFEQLIERCRKADAFCQAADDAAIDARAHVEITIPTGGGAETTLRCDVFLTGFLLPNLYFHAATAYALLRHNGVPLGKRDFLQP
jgi:hypothetical protein